MHRSSSATRRVVVHDLHPEPSDMLAEVQAGLGLPRKTLPCKYFYDSRGSRLFDRICELDEYYPTRTEIGILRRRSGEIADRLGKRVLVIEFGSGSSTKTRLLLQALDDAAGYVPIDIAREHLRQAAGRIAARFPHLPVWPVCADFNSSFRLPEAAGRERERVVFFPGSTIGNFDADGQHRLLRRMATLCEPDHGSLLIGIDLVKDTKRLEAAYNDAEGVTAEFNLNLLRRINRDLDADFELERFEHRAIYDAVEQRIEMQLVSTIPQLVTLGRRTFRLRAGESICTEHSHKFTIDGFAELARSAGWQHDVAWTDDEKLFAVLLLRRRR